MNFFSLIPEDSRQTRSIMIDFDMTRGFIFHGNSQSLFAEIFPKIRSINPKMRVLIFLTDACSSEIYEEIFIIAWQKYRISDLFMLCDDEFRQLFKPLQIFSYNPFSNDKLVKIEFDYNFGEGLEVLKSFMKNRYRDMNQFPLRVVLFRFMMVCYGERDADGNLILNSLKFQDAETLKILSKIANFKIKFVKSPDGIKHGYQTSNFTFTGSLGMVEYENADLAGNARLVAEYNTTNTLCLFPTTTTKLKFSVPKKYWDEVNILAGVYNFLDYSLKIIILVMFLVLPLVIFFFNLLGGSKKSLFDGLTSCYLAYFGIMSFASVKLENYWTSRCVYGGILLTWITVGNTYSGKMIEFLNSNAGLKQIGSIDELIETKLIIKVPYPMAILFEGNFENATASHKFLNRIVEESRKLEKVGDRLAFIDVENMGEMIRSRNYAMLYLDNLIDFLEKLHFDKNGNNILTHIEDSPYEYYYATSVPKTSAFVSRFNEIIMRIFEAGISKYQMMLAMMGNDLIYIRRVKAGQVSNDGLKSLSIKQMSSVFYLYLYAIATCCFVFLLEILFYRISRWVHGMCSRNYD